MLYLLNYRRSFLLWLLVVFIFVSFAAGQAWIPFATLVVFLVALLIVDFLFLDDKQFKYDPDYKNWARAQDPQY